LVDKSTKEDYTMTSYGHPLIFGASLPAHESDEQKLVDIALKSETLGFDLIHVTDRPYDDQYDSWSLLTWIAAQSQRIGLSITLMPSVQLPSVLTHAAASLDLLSKGRLSLGLRSVEGEYEGLVELGQELRSQQELFEQLSETIDLVHDLWDGTKSGAVRFNGEHYKVNGLQRGPYPRHEIPFWLSGSSADLLRLVGEKAEGWIYDEQLSLEALTWAQSQIDRAAQQAGRDPREIRRILLLRGSFGAGDKGLLSGSAQQWVEDLLPFVLAGVSGLLLVSADESELTTFSQEVIPALREAVLARDPHAFSGTVMRPAAIRAKRREGIDYDGIPASLVGTAVEPGDVNYARVKSTYMRGGAPGLVLRPSTTAEVVDAVNYARQHRDLPLAVRSGGHGISGRSTNNGGLVIDLGAMNSIEVLDVATRRIRVGPGARWMQVARAIEPYGWAITSGDYGGVGVGGLATAGGIGFMSRKYGLTIDHVRAVEMVLADGSVVRASDSENPELFWGVRGAGANLGIVTSFEFQADPVRNVAWAQFIFDATNTAQLMTRWGKIVEEAPRELTSFLTLAPARIRQPAIAMAMTMIDSEDEDTILKLLQPMAEIAPLLQHDIYISSYANIIENAQDTDHNGQGEPSSRSGLIDHITPAFAQEAEQFFKSGATYFFQFRAVGGAVSDVSPDATAYANRSANFAVSAMGGRHDYLDQQWSKLYPYFSGLYTNFDSDTRPERITDAFPPATLERLQALKRQYDPENLFRDNFNVAQAQPAESKGAN
jgi:alkanesulfonate monooxygenase SsuD/methylene tetrahydromethanopterin reductase-like flavin-dependent oxidoreductase (luciferase family)